MEFPDLGSHCNLPTCKRLDFLPVQCPGCAKDFCSSHFPSWCHDCPTPPADARVPVCPLCARPIPVVKRGDPPDLAPGGANHAGRHAPAG